MKLFALSASVLLLASCASAIDGQTQDITLRTPGAENARCHLHNEDMKYVIHTDQTISIMKSPHDLEVSCLAPGNREKTITVKREINDWVAGNVATGVAPGMAYDYFSRGGFEYPHTITVDFTGMPVKPYDLPPYHTKDVEKTHINNKVVNMGPNEMITEENRKDGDYVLQKKEGLYGEEVFSDEPAEETGAFEAMVDDIHRRYNPHINYDPSEEEK
jgi:hypothetical protein